MSTTLFVGNLDFSTTSARLGEVFASVGTVEFAEVVRRPDGHSRGFGFVDMATLEDAENAISELDGSTLDGRRINVERATSRATRPHPAAR